MQRKPDWLKVKLPKGQNYNQIKGLLKSSNLHTVCEEALCPNIAECFGCGTATFMILGDSCTRNCKYCYVKHEGGKPVDKDEPRKVGKAVKKLDLKYVVITSVTRDDLPDGGAGVFADTVVEIKKSNPDCKVEVLIPDFKGNLEALKTVISAEPFIINHNIEVVDNLFYELRPEGDYNSSLELLRNVKSLSASTLTKSGLMIGFGETKEDILKTLEDLRKTEVDFLTIGQYLQPTKQHYPVKKFYTPTEFEEFKQIALNMGFKKVESGPLVRSSYKAGSV